jgi:hypothetical protein
VTYRPDPDDSHEMLRSSVRTSVERKVIFADPELH